MSSENTRAAKTFEASGGRVAAILQALFVAFLWSTSWVLIKVGLVEIPPVVFAGLRYFLAFLILLAVFLAGRRGSRAPLMPRQMWGRVLVFGLLMYTIAQGSMFVALDYLPAVTLNLLLNFTTLGVALLSAAWLAERPAPLQWLGIAVSIAGGVIYFHPIAFPQTQVYGLLAAVVCVLANVLATIAARKLNSQRLFSPLQVTLFSMGVGSTALLAAGLISEGIPSISLRNWAFILWLAAVNTAFAFTLWNHTLRTLTAAESSISTGTMLVWIPILAVLFLGEHLDLKQILGLAAVGAGTLLVQLRRRPSFEAGTQPGRSTATSLD